MGNSPSGNVVARPPGHRSREDSSKPPVPSEFEKESESFINDKIKLMPTGEIMPPNPVTTMEFQDQISRFKESQRISNQTTVDKMFEITHKKDELQELDVHAENAPKDVLGTFPDLLEYLFEPIREHRERKQILLRLLLVWLAKQQSTSGRDNENAQGSLPSMTTEEEQRKTPEVLVKLLRQNKTTFSTVFILLCWAAGIKCTKIDGVCRSSDSKEPIPCSWIAVLINSSWQIVNPYRICRALLRKYPEDFTKSDSEISDTNEETDDMIKTSYLEHYIMANPEQFIYEYFPDDSKWQLLPEPISREQFLEQEFLYHPWWQMGLKLTSERKHKLISEEGKISISFEGVNESASDLLLWYDLKIVNTSENVNHEDLQKFVYLSRTSPLWTPPIWNCDIFLPYTGLYKIIFYGGHIHNPLMKICEFEITCDVCHPDPIPLPVNPRAVGIGPGAAMSAAGLSHPSHRSGLINVGMNKREVLKFRVDNRLAQKCKIKANLLSSATTDKDDENKNQHNGKLTNCVMIQNRANKEVMIFVSPPENPGQYILEISTEINTGNESTTRTACFYLLVYELLEKEETYPQMAEKKLLKEAMDVGEITDILIRIQSCRMKKIEENDIDIQRARARAFVLKHKQSKQHKSKHRSMKADQRLQVLSIVQQVQYDTKVHDLIKQLEKLKNYIRKKENTETVSALNEDTDSLKTDSSEMRDAVHHLIELILTLFGKTLGKEQDYGHHIGDILNNLRQHGLVLKPEDVSKAAALEEKYRDTQQQAVHKMFVANILKSVHDIITMLISS